MYGAGIRNYPFTFFRDYVNMYKTKFDIRSAAEYETYIL